MLTGYNTNISYKKKVYHVQTEDSGRNNPVIVSLLYFQGAILASKKTSYAHLLNDADFKTKVREMMKEQHKALIKELLEGKHTPDLQEETSYENKQSSIKPANEAGKEKDEQAIQSDKQDTVQTIKKPTSLDDILLNYIMKREK